MKRSLLPWVRAWKVWSLRRDALVFLCLVEGLFATLTLAALIRAHPTSQDLARFALLACLSGAYGEVEDRVDRSRRRIASGPYIDTTSVWIFPAVLLLPAGYTALLVVLIYTHTLIRARRHRSWLPHRIAFTAAAIGLAALTAVATVQWIAGEGSRPNSAVAAVGTVLAMVSYRVVNDCLIACVIYLATKPDRVKDVLLKPDEFAVETATLVLGAFTAQTVVRMPWLTPAVLLLIVMMYRGLLVKKLEQAAAMDGKTNLLNATAWRELAQRHLWRAAREQQPAAALVIDLDRFKALNDQHGHLAGDVALRAVADCLRHELRDYDALGRYGGEEFVALLPNVDCEAALGVGERVRRRVEALAVAVDQIDHELRVTASVGVASYPQHGSELDELLRSADIALYAAKAAGRNVTRLAATPGPSAASRASQDSPSMPA